MSEGSSKPKLVNPALRMLGIPNLKAKIPSKPWLIFIGLVSTWTGLIVYDRREKKRVQKYWCDRVSHLSQVPFKPNELPRKVTIYLSSPPGDGITVAREYFKEYVKPILVAAAVDYEVIEGRKPGEIRYRVAERTRRIRKGDDDGEGSEKEEAIKGVMKQAGLVREDAPGGILVIGRHTWKEYVRGLHEGWLGSDDALNNESDENGIKSDSKFGGIAETSSSLDIRSPTSPVVSSIDAVLSNNTSNSQEPAIPPRDEKSKDQDEKVRKPQFPPAVIPQSQYPSATLPPSIPTTFQPSLLIPFPHLLGFLNTPFRIQRYLTQRRLMEHVSREVAAIALGTYQPYSTRGDVAGAYLIEETDWPKKWVQRLSEGGIEDEKNEPIREKTVVEELQVDGRIVEKMKKFVLLDDSGTDNFLRETFENQ